MFERFTERARLVVVLAQDEARALKHNYIGREHLLLGLLREEEGLAARVLKSLYIGVEETRSQVARIAEQEVVTVSRAHELAQTVREKHLMLDVLDSRALAELERLAAEDRLREMLRKAMSIVDGRVDHIYRGECPDKVEGPDVRDTDCPACQWLDAAAWVLKDAE